MHSKLHVTIHAKLKEAVCQFGASGLSPFPAWQNSQKRPRGQRAFTIEAAKRSLTHYSKQKNHISERIVIVSELKRHTEDSMYTDAKANTQRGIDIVNSVKGRLGVVNTLYRDYPEAPQSNDGPRATFPKHPDESDVSEEA
jgi:hypothetical protein